MNVRPDDRDSLYEHEGMELRLPYQLKTFKVKISFVAKIFV